MIWSDAKIKANRSIISPFCEDQIQPNSYEVCLSEQIIVSTKSDGITRTHTETLPYFMKPGEFVLGSTIERVDIPNGVVVQVDGKSTLGRSGILIHFTAGLCDSGFSGNITLEMMSFCRGILLTPKMKIAQLVIQDSYPCEKLYGECGNHYQNQTGVTQAWTDEKTNQRTIV